MEYLAYMFIYMTFMFSNALVSINLATINESYTLSSLDYQGIIFCSLIVPLGWIVFLIYFVSWLFFGYLDVNVIPVYNKFRKYMT